MKVGDHVHWTHIGGSRNTISMARRWGTIIEIKGSLAKVEKASGKTEIVRTASLRAMDEVSQITEFVEIMRETIQ